MANQLLRPVFFSGALMFFKGRGSLQIAKLEGWDTTVVQTEIAQQLQDGLPSNFV